MSDTTAERSEPAAEPSLTERISEDFTTVAWVLIPIGVGINVVGGTLTGILRIPLFLDVIGTILVAILAGPWVAVITGGLTNVLLSFTKSPTYLPFALTNIGIALAAGYLAKKGMFQIHETVEYWKLIAGGIFIAIVSTIISTPISVGLFGGITGDPTNVVAAFFLATGSSLIEAVLSQQLIVSPIDKTISVIVAYFIATSIPSRYRTDRADEALEE